MDMKQENLRTQSVSALIADAELRYAPTLPISYSMVDYLSWLKSKAILIVQDGASIYSLKETTLQKISDLFSSEINSLEKVLRQDIACGQKRMDSFTQ